jgi:hypothetical protein
MLVNASHDEMPRAGRPSQIRGLNFPEKGSGTELLPVGDKEHCDSILTNWRPFYPLQTGNSGLRAVVSRETGLFHVKQGPKAKGMGEITQREARLPDAVRENAPCFQHPRSGN